MKTKVFRLFQDRDLQGWEDRGEPYGPTTIEGISNPDGDRSEEAPTSIPSPFARIDLIRSAFKYVVDSENFEDNTIYHKLVSDCFDLAEIFFNIDKLGDRVRIKSWDKNNDLKKLVNAKNPKHKLLGDTLDLFLKQDAQSNNFDELKKMYFLFIDNKIVGGTSPSTLFFTSGNDLTFAQLSIATNDTTFDDELYPLYERDAKFQKYLYTLMAAYPILAERMRDFNNLLEKNLVLLDTHNEALYKEIMDIRELDSEDLITSLNNDYDELSMDGENDYLEILGCKLRKRKIGNRAEIIKRMSQFVIASEKSELKPLVLQNNFNEALIYTDENVIWDPNWVVPYYDDESLNERVLPGQLDNYPYLTVSDFLLPHIIRVPYNLNASNYFTGNTKYENGDETKSFLLPLTKLFFDYFNTSDLQGTMPNGRPMCEMKVYSGSVEVTLRVPIRGNRNSRYVTFTRSYSSAKSDEVDLENNKGIILDHKVSLSIYPFLRVEENSFYRVMSLDQGIDAKYRGKSLDLHFHKNDRGVTPNADKTTRTHKKDGIIQTDFYSLSSDFDFIEVGYNGRNGIVIPILKEYNGSKTMKFAIDFGTTNTHIEYKFADDNGIHPFEISKNEIQYETLHESSGDQEIRQMDRYIQHQFIPKLIGEDSEFSFPLRTATGEKNNLNFSTTPDALADINIPFDYEKYASTKNTQITTNLKWSDFDQDNSDNRVRVEKFIEKLILLIRSKVLFNSGNIAKTELIWFYPSSMDFDKIEKLAEIWDKYAKQYLNRENTKSLSESVAPFYYYSEVHAQSEAVVSIDIGGGTSDIVLFKGDVETERPIALTSVRYAANSIFGDGYGGSPRNNGFIIKYKSKIEELLHNNELIDLQRTYAQISAKNRSEDIIAFYFSLEKNKTVIEKKVPLSFNSFLTNDNDLKIVFLTFYSSLVYHIANLMKKKGLSPTKNILLSGTGAKTILIANGSSNLTKLNRLTKIIFEKVFQNEDVPDIQLYLADKPKEITCKGGLKVDIDKIGDVEDIKTVLVGDVAQSIAKDSNITYTDITKNLLDEVVLEVNNFVDVLFEVNEELNFKKYFGVNPAHLQKYKDVLKAETLNLLMTGVSRKKESLKGNVNIPLEEPLFFYPLVGALNRLSYHIVAEFNK